MSSRRILTLTALTFSGILLAFPSARVEAAAAPQITGVWVCEASRPGSTTQRPLIYTFHSDGTFAYSSQTTVNGGPLALPFTSRGGANGQWQKVGPNDYSYRSIENMYIDGNAGGFFYVEATLYLDPKAGKLCSGGTNCPGAVTHIRLTEFVFDANGRITGETDLLPAGSQAVVTCDALGAVFPTVP